MALGDITNKVRHIASQAASQASAAGGTEQHGFLVKHLTQVKTSGVQQAKANLQKEAKAKAAKHQPAHQLSAKNKAFVQKYGYGDLPEKEVTKYRHQARSIMHAIRHMSGGHKNPALERKAERLIQEAGENPAKRQALTNYYHLLRDGHVRMDKHNAAKAMDVVAEAPHMKLKSARAQTALMSAMDTQEFKSGKLSPSAMTVIVNLAGHEKVSAAKIKKAMPAMASYMSKTMRAHTALAASDEALVRITKINNKAGLAEAKKVQAQDEVRVFQDLHKILNDKDPATQAATLAKKVKEDATKRATTLKTTMINTYKRELIRNGVVSAHIDDLASNLYDLGGPSSPAGQMVLRRLARYHVFKNINGTGPAARRWAESTSQALSKATAGIQPRVFQLLSSTGLEEPKNLPAPERALLTKIGDKFGDALSITSQAVDTLDTIITVAGGAGFGVANAVNSIFVSGVFGGLLTLSSIGYSYKRLEAGEQNRFGKLGYTAALDAIENQSDKTKLMPPEEAYRWAVKLMFKDTKMRNLALELRTNPLTDEGWAAFRKHFMETYKALTAQPRTQAQAFASAMLISGPPVQQWSRAAL